MNSRTVKINVRIPRETYIWISERSNNISKVINEALDEYVINRSYETLDDNERESVEHVLRVLSYQMIAKKNNPTTELSREF